VQAYRLLVHRLDQEKLKPYPLHLGVTEAGEGEDGRIKSAMGIGTLLEDGLGDTVRVSLTEDPEFEAPVAKSLIDRYLDRNISLNKISYNEITELKTTNPFSYSRRETIEVGNFGGLNVPRVIADCSEIEVAEHEDLRAIGHFYLPLPDKWRMNDLGADYIFSGKKPIPFMLPNGLKEILDYDTWLLQEDKQNKLPLFSIEEIFNPAKQTHSTINFVSITIDDLTPVFIDFIKNQTNVVLVVEAKSDAPMIELRSIYFNLLTYKVKNPVVLRNQYESIEESDFQLFSATDCGGVLIEGFGDGILLDLPVLASKQESLERLKVHNSTSFGILQAARTRMSKTEYISCPSCGRTLFDLQETTAMIRKRTDHLKGVKIGIMGCIVNGPGEMADADYGYVGIGKDKIALYRGQTVVKKSVHANNAVDELMELIKEDGRWFEQEVMEYETA
jgi:(E)-4-hydroxy-3-methylbut-2-enyl-diphosphate synthase